MATKSEDQSVTHKTLAHAVIAVMREVKGMEKNSRVGGSSAAAYDGTMDRDVKEVFNEKLAQHGLCALPIDIIETTQIDRWEEVDPWSKLTPKGTKWKQQVFTKVNCKYLLMHADSGESQVIAGYGHGVDPQDKGAGKATTYALKNSLLYAFLTPVGKIDDAEKDHSNDLTTPPPAKKPAAQAPVKQTPPAAQAAAKPNPKAEEAIAKCVKAIGEAKNAKELGEVWKKVPEKLQKLDAITRAAAAKKAALAPKKEVA